MDYQIYFIPTPIGNLEDITIRAINILKEVNIIACEDTRESRKLLDHYGINKTLTSYHKFNEMAKSEEIINKAMIGKTYAIITDQGMPGLSDPGHILIKKCIENSISYTILPGASSVLTALIGSGMYNDKFSYYGFIPKKSSDKNKLYDELKNEYKTSILFDTPHNLDRTIEDFKKIFPERKLCIARELTKKFEEYILIDIKDIDINNLTLKGEFVLILSGREDNKSQNIEDLEVDILNMLSDGLSTKDIVKDLRKQTEFSKNEIYDYVIELSNK